MATLYAADATQAEAAIRTSAPGDIIRTEGTGDITIPNISGVIKSEANPVTITGTARLRSLLSGPADGLLNCRGFRFADTRLGTFQLSNGGGYQLEGVTHTGQMKLRGNLTGFSAVDGWSGGLKPDGSPYNRGRAFSFDGRGVNGTHDYVTDTTVSNYEFSFLGDDSFFLIGVRNCDLLDLDHHDISAYLYGPQPPPTNRQHAESIEAVDFDGLRIIRNTHTRIEWNPIIALRHGWHYGWEPSHNRGLLVKDNTFSQIGSAEYPGHVDTVGGVCIMLINMEDCRIEGNVALDRIHGAGLRWFYQDHPTITPDPTYDPASFQVREGNNQFASISNKPTAGGLNPADGPPLLPLTTEAVLEFVARDAAGNLSAPFRVTIPIA